MSQHTHSPKIRRTGQRPASSRVASGGFNLVELMTVIAIGAILLGMGTASYRYVTSSNRVSTEVNSLLGDLMLARSEAVKQGLNVVACPSHNGSSCDDTNDWRNGWIIFSDPDGDHQYSAGSNDGLIRVQKAFTVASDTFQSDQNVQYIIYNREGFATGLPITNNFITITLHTSPPNTQWTRCLQIGSYGALTTERYQEGTCL